MLTAYCQGCKNYLERGKCRAFPEGIPADIITGKQSHDKPLPNQGNDIVYERIEFDLSKYNIDSNE